MISSGVVHEPEPYLLQENQQDLVSAGRTPNYFTLTLKRVAFCSETGGVQMSLIQRYTCPALPSTAPTCLAHPSPASMIGV